jgi:hypothetical protein
MNNHGTLWSGFRCHGGQTAACTGLSEISPADAPHGSGLPAFSPTFTPKEPSTMSIPTLLANPNLPNDTGWQDRHNTAIRLPNSQEDPLVRMLQGWANYAMRHGTNYDSSIGDDGVLGPEWEAIGNGLLGLLNGNLGRLDAGTLDAFIRDTMSANGIDVSNK